VVFCSLGPVANWSRPVNILFILKKYIHILNNASGGQRKVENPKTSRCAHFRWCNSKRMVETLKMNTPVHFQGWWLIENVQNPKNEQSCSFSGLVVVSGRLVEIELGGYPGDVYYWKPTPLSRVLSEGGVLVIEVVVVVECW